MSFEYRSFFFEMDYEAYMRFLLEHDSELNLPYAFGMKLSFVSSPIALGQGMLILAEETGEVVGAVGFVYGTGVHEYEDREVCQIEVAFLREEYRGRLSFRNALRALVDQIQAGNPDVKTVQFWVPAGDEELRLLFAKLVALPGSTQSRVNDLDLYKLSYAELASYSRHGRAAIRKVD